MKYLTFLLIFFLVAFSSKAQEETVLIHQGKKYIDLNIHSLEKYSKRIDRQQKRLLSKLKRKEHRLERKLKNKDSANYSRLSYHSVSYDSINKLLKPDSVTIASKTARKTNKVVDSLERIQSFITSKSSGVNSAINITNNKKELAQLQSKLEYQQYINQLIDQRSLNLKNFGNSSTTNIPILKGIQKDAFYGKSKMNAFKQMADEPSKAEEAALEYLQGTDGFEAALKPKGNENSMQSATSADDLEKMGFQTKRQLNAQLKKQFGNNVASVQEKMSSEISNWQQKTNGIGNELKNTKQQIKAAKTDIQQTKQSIKQLKHTNKLGFKINPMKGLPFWKRVEKSWNWQTARATSDGKTPALIQLSAMAGFKQSPRLSYGLGIATSIGLGQNWSTIHFSFEGVGLRSYTACQWKYGIGAYAGYERFYKQAVFTNKTETIPTNTLSTHNKANYNESALIGLTKTYKINTKWNGSVQVLCDIWWKEKGLNSPIVLRFTTNSN